MTRSIGIGSDKNLNRVTDLLISPAVSLISPL